MGASEDPPPVSLPRAFVATVKAVLLALAKTIFASDVNTMITRTSIFLIIFLVIHMLGNLNVFFGAAQLNCYGHLLHINPLLKIIELYLALSFVLHAVAGVALSWRKRAALFKGGVRITSMNRLALSAVIASIFVVVHLVQVKFGKYYEYILTTPVSLEFFTIEAGTRMRDIYKLQLELFANPLIAHGYVLGIVALGAHVWWGWSKAVHKLGIPKHLTAWAALIGQGAVVILVAGFSSGPLYVHYKLA